MGNDSKCFQSFFLGGGMSPTRSGASSLVIIYKMHKSNIWFFVEVKLLCYLINSTDRFSIKKQLVWLFSFAYFLLLCVLVLRYFRFPFVAFSRDAKKRYSSHIEFFWFNVINAHAWGLLFCLKILSNAVYCTLFSIINANALGLVNVLSNSKCIYLYLKKIILLYFSFSRQNCTYLYIYAQHS